MGRALIMACVVALLAGCGADAAPDAQPGAEGDTPLFRNPATNEPLESTSLVTNHTVKKLIAALLEEHRRASRG